MRFKDKKGNILVDITDAHSLFCNERDCYDCPFDSPGDDCDTMVRANPIVAAQKMGLEIVGDEPKVYPTRDFILETAKQCVCGDREQDYGSPEDSFALIASFWKGYIKQKCVGSKVEVDINPEDVAAMLGLLKIARIASGRFKTDSWVDLAGYAACGGEIQGGRIE